MSVLLKYDDLKLQADVTRMLARMDDLTPAMTDIGEYLIESTKKRFESSTAPDGSRWKQNRPATLARKPKDVAKPLIGETKSLSTMIHYRPGRRNVTVESLMEYAATHQYGAKKGEFGRTKRGAPIPWGDIPAREFMGVSEKDQEVIEDILSGFVFKVE